MKLPTLSNQTLVQISVRDKRLHLYPQRAQDVVIYHVDARKRAAASPTKPHEVRWVVEGMAAAQKVVIAADPAQKLGVAKAARSRAVMKDGKVGVLSFAGPGEHTALSGKPTGGPGQGHERGWKYDIVLYDHGKEVHRIDPTVIIKEDP